MGARTAPSRSIGGEPRQIKATAGAIARAEALDVKLADLEGTGKGGRITVPDVRKAALDAAAGGDDAGAAIPSDLSTRARRNWRDVEEYLERTTLFESVQRETIELYVRAVDRAIEMRKVADQAPTVSGSKGQEVLNPIAKIAESATLEAHRWAEALLLTPSAIQRHLRSDEGGDGEDDLGF